MPHSDETLSDCHPPLPEAVWLEEGIEGERFARDILASLSGVPHRPLPPGGFREIPQGHWILRRHRGRFLKPCPGTRNYLCCGYRVLNVVVGCPFGCAYCILGDYLAGEGITVYVNLEDMKTELRGALDRHGGIVRIGTGELADSLALEPWLRMAERLVPFFGTLPNAILELKTKSAAVGGLLRLDHAGHTVVSWSLNPQSVIDQAEPGTPALASRLRAAALCQEAGYPVGLHFDPMVHFEGWREEYRGLVREVFRVLDPRSILWISLGALRFPPSMKESLLPSGLGLGELFAGLDKKLRYLRPVRERMFRDMAGWIREFGGELFTYLCMESPDIWRDSLGWAPQNRAELDRVFQDRIRSLWNRNSQSHI